MGIKIHTVTYRHEYGTDTYAYISESLAYQGACELIANWIMDLENHESVKDLVELINDKDYEEALELWSEMVADFDLGEEITIDSTEIVTHLEPLVIDTSSFNFSNDDEETTEDE